MHEDRSVLKIVSKREPTFTRPNLLRVAETCITVPLKPRCPLFNILQEKGKAELDLCSSGHRSDKPADSLTCTHARTTEGCAGRDTTTLPIPSMSHLEVGPQWNIECEKR